MDPLQGPPPACPPPGVIRYRLLPTGNPPGQKEKEDWSWGLLQQLAQVGTQRESYCDTSVFREDNWEADGLGP